MNDRETARDLSKRLEKAQEEIALLRRILALRPDDIATSTPAIAIHLNSENNSLREEIARQRVYLKTISWVALSHGVISRGLFAAANNINRADIDEFVKKLEGEDSEEAFAKRQKETD
jgi:hypothetical protein